jgi:DNA polymerase-3 subunit epsilon
MTEMADDPRVQHTRFVVIDFEGLTPAGRLPVPIEVAAVTAMLSPTGKFTELDCYESLMAPPPDVPITRFDQASGITERLLATAPAASAVMSELDGRVHAAAIDAGHAVLLVAHYAATERTLLHAQRSHCPRLADTPLLDTLRLARACLPNSPRMASITWPGTFSCRSPATGTAHSPTSASPSQSSSSSCIEAGGPP